MIPLPLIFFTFILGILPLNRVVFALWNVPDVLLVLYCIFFYTWVFLRKRYSIISPSIYYLCLLTSFFILTAGIIGTYPFNSLEIGRMLAIIWTIPIGIFCVKEYGASVMTTVLIGVVMMHALWGMAQFIIQDDLGLQYIGESALDTTTPGVAKFQFDSYTKLIRAYGPYPHPNSLSGVMSIALAVLFISYQQHRTRIPTVFAAGVLTLGMLMTFSRAALLSVILAIGGIVLIYWPPKKKEKKWRPLFLPIIIIVVVFLPLLLKRAHDPQDQAFPERSAGIRWSTSIIREHVWTGVGPGNYRVALADYLTQQSIIHEPWQLDRVHVVPLLALTEWGVVVTLGVSGILVYTFKKLNRESRVIVVSLMPLLLLDHYFLSQTAPLVMALQMVIVSAYSPQAQEQAAAH